MVSTTSSRVARHRSGLRAAGLRPLQIWVPDTRRTGFDEECRRQSSVLKGDPHEIETFNWLDEAADSEGWT